MNQVTCDECKKLFVIQPMTQQLDDGVVRTYFACSHCEHSYTAFYTNAEIRRMQLEMNRLRQQAGKVKNIKEHDKLVAKMDRLQKQINSKMDLLRIRIEG